MKCKLSALLSNPPNSNFSYATPKVRQIARRLDNIAHTTVKGQLNLTFPTENLLAAITRVDLLKLRLELQNIELDTRDTRDTDIELMNFTREEVISIARGMI